MDITELWWQDAIEAICGRLSRLKYVMLAKAGLMVPRRLSPVRSNATTCPRRCPLEPQATPRHWHIGMDRLPHDARAPIGSPFTSDLNNMSAR